MKNITNLLILRTRNIQRISDKLQEYQVMVIEESLVLKKIILKVKLEIVILISP